MSKQHSSRNRAKPSAATNIEVVSGATRRTGEKSRAWRLAAVGEKLRSAYWLIPVALALLSSAGTLWNEFATDDTQQVLSNVFIRDLKNLPLAFTSSVWSFVSLDIAYAVQPYFRPLFSVLFTLNYAIFGTSPWGWHLVNILIHAAVTGFAFLVCREVTGDRKIALITASLFAVHPAHAESVAWVSGVTDPLMSLFLLPAFYLYLRHRERGGAHRLAFTALLFLCALWSKETAAALLLVVVYCELFHFPDAGPFRQRLLRAATYVGALLVPLAIYLLTRNVAMGGLLVKDELRYPFGAALLTMPLATLKYLWLLTVPVGYSYQHFTPFVSSAAQLRFILPLALLAAVAVATALWGSRAVRFGAVWFIAFLAPALASIRHFDPPYVVQERYLYLSLMGFCLVVALGINQVARRWQLAPSPRVAVALTAVLVVIWGALYARHGRFWHDTVSIFERCVVAEPDSPEAHSTLAGIYYAMGKTVAGEGHLQRALELDPQCLNARVNHSYFARQAGRIEQSIARLEEAITVVPPTPLTRSGLATAHLNLSMLYEQQKDFPRAEEHLHRSVALWNRAIGWYYLGLYYSNRERYEEALQYYEKARTMLPSNYAVIHLPIGATYERLEQFENAIAAYNRYLQLVPETVADRANVANLVRQLETKHKSK